MSMGKTRRLTAFLIAVCCVLTVNSVSAEKDEYNYSAAVSDQGSDNIKSYSSYFDMYSDAVGSSENIIHEMNGTVLDTGEIEFEISVEKSGLFGIGMSYKALDDLMSDISIGVKIDGEYPYEAAESFSFPRMWRDEEENSRFDASGNEYSAKQIRYTDYFYNEAIDEAVEKGDKFFVYLSEGVHRISLVPDSGKIQIEYFKFSATSSPEKYSQPNTTDKLYNDKPIIIEGESASVKSDYFLVGKSDNSTTEITPHSAGKSLINYIGGGNWKTVGETIVWETPELDEGYYCLGFSFRQNGVIGGKSYRTLKIDGKVPFAEAEKIGFEYSDNWQQKPFANEDSEPYLIYLSAGKHTLSLTVTSGDISRVRQKLTQAVSDMGQLYIDISKITGETVDIYRDYDLFGQISDMEERLENICDLLNDAAEDLLDISGAESGSNYSVIKNMVEVIEQMLKNKFEAHRYKSYYYSNYCSVSSVLQDLRSMPLDIDKIILYAYDDESVFDNSSFFEKIIFSVKRFVYSFTQDYDAVSDISGDTESLTIWVSWGRDQAQVLSSLVDRSFTPETGIKVNIKLVNATVIQAVLSGNGPDCLLQSARSEPVNLAMRNVLYDLTKFDDYKEVLKRFQDGADTPYWYKGGLYALPDTQTFFVMFYRKDILEEYGIEVPKTWDEFDLAAKLLMRNNMSVSLPNTVATDVAQASAGVGANNIYPSLLLQRGIPMYAEDGKKTNLLSSEAMEVFEKWTDYYSKMKFPVSLDFYNRFRTGTTPLGISTYSLYTTLKTAAPEIDGLWSFTAIPGTLSADGSISRVSAGGGTGCSILKMSENPENAWEFLKWWTDYDTQLTFSNDIESILGPVGRVALSNVEAVKGLAWDKEILSELLSAWEQVEEIPEYPGSYYVSRSVYQAFWNVVNDNKNTKDMLMKYGKEADDEIARKWKQYENRY